VSKKKKKGASIDKYSANKRKKRLYNESEGAKPGQIRERVRRLESSKFREEILKTDHRTLLGTFRGVFLRPGGGLGFSDTNMGGGEKIRSAEFLRLGIASPSLNLGGYMLRN